jgi:antitoxin CcdA
MTETTVVRKRATNVTLDEENLALARAAGMNVSAICDAALAAAVQEERKRKFMQENKEAIDAYNARVRKHGMWNKSLRMF